MSQRRRSIANLVLGLPTRLRGAVDILRLDPVAPASVVGILEDWAAKDPRRPFLLFEGERITYSEMARRIRRRAATLASRGVRRGDVVALMMSNHPQFLVNAWAISYLGAVASLINTALAGTPLAHALTSTPARLVIASRELVPVASHALDVATADGVVARPPIYWEEIRGAPYAGASGPEEASRDHELAALDAEPAREVSRVVTLGDDTFAYIFTSGTTGLPKAGKITHSRAITAANGFGRAATGLAPDDVFYVCLPLFHSSGFLIGACGSAVTGATLALARKLSVSRFWDDIADTGATAFVYIGEVCRYLVQAAPHPREREHRLRRIIGNGMRPDVWKAFVERFEPGIVHEFYGATEGNVNMMNLFGVHGSVGRLPPLPGYDNAFLAKFDPTTERPARDARGLCIPCKTNEPGELLGRIDPSKPTMRFDGYLGDAATEAKIVRDVEKHGDAFFRSGDLLKKDRLGFYYFVDRIGDTFRWKGENVSTNEVGDVCARAAGVELANVYGVAVPGKDGRAGMVALTLLPDAAFSPDRFYEHVMSELAPYAAPLFVRLLSAAEVTQTFKLKKQDLLAQGFDPRRTDDLLFVRDDGLRTYRELDLAEFERIERGEARL
ncbi:MAG: long-chain-acyl-CoA synthetase [Polyangiaceae bacterium]